MFSSIKRVCAITSSTAWSRATMSSEPKMPASGRMGMLVKPKQSHTGVMWVARPRCVGFAGREGGQGDGGADGAGFLEGMEIDRVDLQAAGRRHLQAAPALVALLEVQVQLAGMVLVLHQGLEAGRTSMICWRVSASGHFSGNQ